MMTTGVFRLGADARKAATQNGKEFGVLSLAATYYDPGTRDTDTKGRETQWLHCTCSGSTVDRMGQYLVKGTLVEASIADVHIRTYRKDDGDTGTDLSGRVVAINFAGGRNEGRSQAQASAP